MNRAFMIVSIVIAVSAIGFGKVYWNQKISAEVTSASEKQEISLRTEAADAPPIPDVKTLAKNLPDDVQRKLSEAPAEKKPLKLVVFGSDTTSGSEENWGTKIEKELENAYTKEALDVVLVWIPDATTKAVIEKKLYEKMTLHKPDILLIEPFILKDNGVIGIDHTLDNISVILSEAKKSNKNMTIFIQPSYPLHNAVFYPKETELLKEYADKNNYVYLDHWKEWPEHTSEQILPFLASEGDGPSPKGHEIWSGFLVSYFVNEQ